MKSMFSQISNSSLLNHAKRLALAVVFLSFAAIVKASGGGGGASQEARFYIYTVQLKESTGSGKVYISNQAEGLSIYEEEGSKREFRLSYPDTTSISKYNTSGSWGYGATTANFHVHNTTLSENATQTMAASLIAAPDPGTKFEGWTYEAVVLTGNNKYHENYGEYDVPTTYTPTINGNEYKFSFDLGPFTSNMKVSLSQHTAIYAKFTARTYYAEKLPKVEVITINQDGEELIEVGGSTPTFQLSDAPVSGIKMGERNTSFSDYFSQTADNYGQNAEATFMWTFATTPTPKSTYDYLGWKMTEGDYLNNLQTGESVIAKAISEDANKPTEHTIYVIYQLEKFNLFHYDALNDAFNVMPVTSTADGVANYTYSNNEVGEQLFRILSGQSGALTISETTLFTTTLEEINNMNVLRVVPNNPTGGKETITIFVAGSPVATLEIDMLNEVKSVTLNPAENLEGTYTYKQNTTGDQAFTVNNAPVTKVLVNPSDFTFTFNPNPISGYAFKRWCVEKTGEQPIYHTTPNLQITFAGGESITPEFEAIKDKAAFIVNGYPDVLYYDLQAAIDAAANSTKVVAVHTNGVLAQGDYTIHSGVTLLVPGKDHTNGKYDVLTSALTKNNFNKDVGTWNQYRTLVVEDNTTINVTEGNISLYAYLSAASTNAGGGPAGRPHSCGVMVLGKDCKITVSKGGLYAFGYIIGDNSSEIVMESGTTVYEVFQFTDFRGGTATLKWFSDLENSDVFPIGQYYVQNIEVPLTLKYGAIEKLSSALYASILGVQAVDMFFIGQSGKNNDQGLLCLEQDGTSITKTYDPSTDRLSLSVRGPKAKLSYISLKVTSKDINSYDYILPIMSNIDFFVEGTQIDMYDNSALAFMPGSTLTLSAGSNITVGSTNRLYFYDHDERKFSDGTGYWYPNTKILIPLEFRPANTWEFSDTPGKKSTGANMLYNRTEKDLVDAKMLINGSMTINGALYTTAGGANITSDGGGTIVVNKLGTATETQQVSQGDVVEKPVSLSSPAKLHNRETASINTTNFNAANYYKFQNYTDVASTGTYIYYQTEGVWKQPEDAKISGYKIYNTNNEEIESFNITLPTDTAEGYVLCQLVPVDGVDYDENDFTISLTGESFTQGKVTVDGNQIKIPITYKAQNKHNITSGVSATLTISKSGTAEPAINVNETIPLIAYENYQPAFTVPSSVLVRSSLKEANGEWHPYALDIQIPEDNVAALAEGANATATANGSTITLTGHNTSVVWTAAISGTNADQFSFQFGETNNALKDAAVLFRPTTASTKSATLTLTAKYTDANDPAQKLTQQHVITLSGEGAISDNTMDFASVGAIKKNSTFDLLTLVNSSAALSYTINPAKQNIIEITPKTDANGKPNYDVKASNIGSVTITVTQEASTVVKGKTITRTIVVQSNADKLETNGSCIDTEASFNKLTADYENVNYAFVGETLTVSFNTTQEKQSATWSLQFTDMPGYIQFTPSGDGQWSLQESTSGMPGSWTELLAWTEFESGKPVFLPLSPETRAISISYYGITAGKLTDICVYPLTLVPEDNVIYMPIREGKINETVLFTHNTNSGTIEVKDNTDNSWGSAVASPENLGGLLQVYYRTPVTIYKSEVEPGRYTLKATLGSLSADLTIIAYEIPHFLPINSSEWGEADFYHYMNEASHELDNHYVKWNAEQKKVVFTTPVGEITNPERYVVFGFNGYPTDMSFTSTSRDWTIYSSVNAQDWAEVTADSVPIADANGIFTIQRELHHSAKYIKITSAADDLAEVAINNVNVVGEEVVEITDPTPADPVDLTYAELEISRDGDGEAVNTFTLFVANMEQLKVELNSDEFELKRKHVTDETWLDMPNDHTLTNSEYAILAPNEAGEITFQVKWKKGTNIVNEGAVSIKNGSDELLATVRLVGKKSTITADDANTGINTGVPNGYTLNGESFEPYTYHEVNVQNAFSIDKEPVFDYLFIYGETTTKDGSTTITTPRIENNDTLGSNAKTPYYIYKKNTSKKGYDFVQLIENANAASKISLANIDHEEKIIGDENRVTYAIKPKGNTPLNVYITGFCPYATTGSTKDEEGVWYFRGDPGQILNVYLEDCHIYSRNKSENGEPTAKNVSPSFSDADVVHGSGAVLVFENSNSTSGSTPFNVTIHTRGHNLLKSNFGCYYTMILDAQVTQVSSPIQIRLGEGIDYNTASTTLNFDDLWPIGETSGNVVTSRTNGFLSLQKLVNNAPSIDMGNSNTIVNFNGGQIQLQNSQIVSPNYKTTLAISYRSGLFGNLPNLKFAYGVGTDAVGGTVNFNDGTTTVLPMNVDEQYRSFYLMDKDAEGKDLATTSCLRCPTNTYVYGGSHCMIRACGNVTSKGGAPKDGPDGKLLGRYIYKNDTTTTPKQGYTYHERVMTELPTDLTEYAEGATVIVIANENMIKYHLVISENGDKQWQPLGNATFFDPYFIVTPTNFPGDLQYNDGSLATYYESYPTGEYGLQSVTPDDKGNLYFWIPEGVVPDVTPEQDKLITVWKACMTEIEAGAMGLTGSIGGSVTVESSEEVRNLLYCQLDEDIYKVISDSIENGVDSEGETIYKYSYAAPVVDPTNQLGPEDRYQMISPTHVGANPQEEITSTADYEVTDKIYYITTAMADTWMNFAMPFNVEKIWVVESFPEELLEKYCDTITPNSGETRLQATKRYQAQHNADFAAFFGVAMALGADHLDFQGIYERYLEWAMNIADKQGVEGSTGLYESGEYTLRGKYPLTHYNGSNFTTSNFYLYKNIGDWTIQNAENSQFTTQWQIVPEVEEGAVLMEKGQVYSMLFPYCQGCDVEWDDETNNIKVDEDSLPVTKARDYWDYWSGKFLIFESTDGPHRVNGANYVAKDKVDDSDWLFDNHEVAADIAQLLGNSTFAMMQMEGRSALENIYTYAPQMSGERFNPYSPTTDENGDIMGYPVITPTSTFLLTGVKTANPIKLITRAGQIIYGTSGNGTTTGGNMPTVGGDNDLFVTSIAGGINIAVAAPQYVRVLSSTGALLFSGMVQTSVDVTLPANGVYVIAGENEVQKILY